MARLLSLLLLLVAAAAVAEAPPGRFSERECRDCHAEHDTTLIEQWRSGPHAGTAGCVECHGVEHGALAEARADAVCVACHQGPASHSYATSKHGVRNRLDPAPREAPLERGRYRAPGCAYCHLHGGDHGDSAAGERLALICGGCHAPRYVRRQLESGERLLAVGALKRREAIEVAERHPRGRGALAETLKQVERHIRNLRLGAGHQSPDYQWWHGQPALDGDLIRLRERVAEALRERALEAHR